MTRTFGKFSFIFYAALLTNLLAFASCSTTRSADQTNAGGKDNEAPIAVTVGKSEARNVPAVIQTTGSLVANETSNVAPKIAGKVTNVSVDVGDYVSQGAMIAKINDSDQKRNLAGAEAEVKKAVAAVRQAEAKLGLGPGGKFNASAIPEVRTANANYEQALAEQHQAEANEKRYRDLVETGDVAMITYEQYRTARDTARARARAAKETLDAQVNTAKQNNQAIASSEAGVEAAKTQAETAQQELADTVVRAPFSGFVTSRPIAVGEFVSSADIIATIIRSNPIKIQMQVAEADIPSIRLGRGVTVRVDAYKDRNFAGTVSAINPAVDLNSRSTVVEALIENNDNALRSGMFATASITKEGGSMGVFVPKSAVYNDVATGAYRVFVVADGIVKLHVVQIGNEEGELVQVLSGLDANLSIATSNLDQLYEGARVAV